MRTVRSYRMGDIKNKFSRMTEGNALGIQSDSTICDEVNVKTLVGGVKGRGQGQCAACQPLTCGNCKYVPRNGPAHTPNRRFEGPHESRCPHPTHLHSTAQCSITQQIWRKMMVE